MALPFQTLRIRRSDVPADFGDYELHVILSGCIDGVLDGRDNYISLNLDNRSEAEYAEARKRVCAFMAQYGVVPGSFIRQTGLGVSIRQTSWIDKTSGLPVRVTWGLIS